MADLANCPNCGQVFIKNVRDICTACYEKEENMFETVYNFMREKKHRMATMHEICKVTGVPEKTITRFIKEGRLRLADFPNLSYPCHSCGTPIREGNLCDHCRNDLRNNLDVYEKEQQFEQRKRESMRAQTYFSDKLRN